MAKIVKKKPVAKAAAKSAKKTAAKSAAKPAPKKAAKPVVKKKVEKAPAKAVVKKAAVKKKPEAKPAKAAKPVKAAKEVKETAKKPEKKTEKKTAAPAPVVEKAAPKKESKAAASKKPVKGKKEKDDSDIEDDFIADEDLMGDEIGEYEEELKAVEESDDDVDVEEEWTGEEKQKIDEDIVLTDAEGRRYCRARDCDQISAVDIYCRYHYLLFWKKIQVRKEILIDGKLEKYVEELTSRYPDKFLEMIRRDLRTEKDFLGAIQELEIDESAGESEFEEDTAYIEEVRGMGESGSSVDDDEY